MTSAAVRLTLLPVAFLLTLAGIVGFFLPFAIAAEGHFLPPTFEWPVWRAEGAVTMEGGLIAVPIQHAGRVQLYDATATFVRGIEVTSSGGTFWLAPGDNDTVIVDSARGRRRETYDASGTLVASTSRPADSRKPDTRSTPTLTLNPRWYVFVLFSPAIAWLTAVLGVGLMYVVTSTLSNASGRTLRAVGVVSEDGQVSKPSFHETAWSVIGLVMFLFVVVSAPLWFSGIWFAILMANLARMRTRIWGFEVTGTHVRVWLPLRRELNTVLTPDEVIAGVAKMPANSYVRLPGKRRFELPAIGTTRFRLLVDHAARLKAGADAHREPAP